MSTIFGRRLRRCTAILVAVGAMLTAGANTAHAMNTYNPGAAPVQAVEQPPEVEPQIIGGAPASEPYSWMATLGFIDGHNENTTDLGHQCGGTLIFSKWVLTAEHCVAPRPAGLTAEQEAELLKQYGLPLDWFSHDPTQGSFYARVGSHDRTSGGQMADVTQIVIHPGFRWFAGAPTVEADDIAMLRLDHQLTTQPIQLAGEVAEQGDPVRLLGWGITEPDTTGNDPITLQELDTTIGSDGRCGGDGGLSAREICVNNVNGTDGVCFGDSGSPAVEKINGRWKFVGITSRGGRWCGTTAAIYTSSPEFRTWIYDTARGTPASAAVTPIKTRVKIPCTTPGATPAAGPEYTLPFEPPAAA